MFADVTLSSVWSYNLFSVCRGFLLSVTVMALLLVAWNFIFHSSSQTHGGEIILYFSASWGFTRLSEAVPMRPFFRANHGGK